MIVFIDKRAQILFYINYECIPFSLCMLYNLQIPWYFVIAFLHGVRVLSIGVIVQASLTFPRYVSNLQLMVVDYILQNMK